MLLYVTFMRKFLIILTVMMKMKTDHYIIQMIQMTKLISMIKYEITLFAWKVYIYLHKIFDNSVGNKLAKLLAIRPCRLNPMIKPTDMSSSLGFHSFGTVLWLTDEGVVPHTAIRLMPP